MGRPPLHMEATVIRLPKEVREEIDALVGKKRRAVFIRAAIEEKLDRERGQDADKP